MLRTFHTLSDHLNILWQKVCSSFVSIFNDIGFLLLICRHFLHVLHINPLKYLLLACDLNFHFSVFLMTRISYFNED